MTEALGLVRVSARQRLIGHVAVKTAVSLTPRPKQAVKDARYWLARVKSIERPGS